MNPMMAMLMTCLACIVLTTMVSISSTPRRKLTEEEILGRSLFLDSELSSNASRSCASCHDALSGFSGPDSAINAVGAVYEGALSGRFGRRKPFSFAYQGECPPLTRDAETGNFYGGLFRDGHATGWTMGDPLAEVARVKLLDPLTLNMASPAHVMAKISSSSYASLFMKVWGKDSLAPLSGNAELVMERIAKSIAAYGRSPGVNPFSSKYDAHLANLTQLTRQERLGLELFEGKARCANCHVTEVDWNSGGPLFTDFSYDNVGVPVNTSNPYYAHASFNPEGHGWTDLGLGGFLLDIPKYQAFAKENIGKHRVPSLRNVDRRPAEASVKAYGHNGYFKSLREVVHFFNTRDVAGAVWNGKPWPKPEVGVNINGTESGRLGLSDEEEEAIVAFLKTLTDGYIHF